MRGTETEVHRSGYASERVREEKGAGCVEACERPGATAWVTIPTRGQSSALGSGREDKDSEAETHSKRLTGVSNIRWSSECEVRS